MTTEEFLSWKRFGIFTNMTLSQLFDLMIINYDVKIITDYKGSELNELLEWICKHKSYQNLKGRIIPQFYQQDNFSSILTYGYSEYWYTAYREKYELQNPIEMMKFVGKYKSHNIKVVHPWTWVENYPGWKQLSTNVDTILHTVNEIDSAKRFKKFGYHGIMTDYLFGMI